MNHALPDGFRASGIASGIKKGDQLDLGILIADEAWPAWALFTQNHLLGAHIDVCNRHLRTSGGRVRAVIVNSGNANCATGQQGIADAETMCKATARLVDCPPHEVLCMSTGVIGAALPIDKIEAALPSLVEQADASGIEAFATAIMTTDTVAKLASTQIHRPLPDGGTDKVQVTGVAKGSGMIHPDMATMLGFLLTDGASEADLGMGMVPLADDTFHRVTVDGDTSPNDTFLLWSSNQKRCPTTQDGDGRKIYPLEDALVHVGRDLSRQIARDGEGATRLVTIQVRGGMSDQDVLDVGRFIATSPLVKTAVFGRDPNWGRILSAAGTAGMPMNLANARVWIGEFDLYSDGKPHPENEAGASDYLATQAEVVLGVDLGAGPFAGEVWTCDLSKDYVSINADYRS